MIFFATNIEKLRKERGMDIIDFVPIVNKTYSTVHNYFTGKTEPRFKVIESFARFFNVSISDLLGRDLTKLKPISDYNGRVEDPEAVYYKVTKTAPIIPVEASAGILTNLSEAFTEDDIHFTSVPSFMGKVDFYVRINGDSMVTPDSKGYPNGSFITARTITEKLSINPGREYVIDTKDGLIMKTFDSVDDDGFYVLTSLNPKYRPIKIHESDVNNIGVVTGYFTHV